MIRRIRFDSSVKNNNYTTIQNSVSFGGPLIKYGFPQRDWDEFRPLPTKMEKEPPMIKYGYPQIPFETEETTVDNTEKTDIPEEEILIKYGIPQPFDEPEESDEDVGREIIKDLFPEEDYGDGVEKPKAEAPKQKTSYFKRLWCAILGKDTQ